ncbi:diaminopimelate epimerase [Rothia sp. AR01]|uniref:Diaminopimelate epimerase n=1 Tax=Rothia santali TaxID=2949643 RepID=A0A9X2H9P2_9MICC|nr:diaminopimelate epimerase [Rothia santali]MCP3425241.1 diaminopimelate epimerase [Rothia santali]
MAGVELTKGHGTGNDFVLLTDPEAGLPLEADLVAAVCDRHRGIGADGLIRAVRSASLPEGRELLAGAPGAEWFMDYRNADGSISEMCGNGVRVFVHYLLSRGLTELDADGRLTIGTRGGAKTVARTETGYAVDMGPWGFIHGDEARDNGSDSTVTARGLRTPRPALSISMGNPHTVVALAGEAKLEKLGLTEAPGVRPTPPHGTNVEFVVPVESDGDESVGGIAMRVHERGVGETQSCGTGACAAAAATRFWAGDDAPDEWVIEVPGGTLGATFVLGPDELEHVVLSGPATLVGRVVLD